jgi:hypothetical protein
MTAPAEDGPVTIEGIQRFWRGLQRTLICRPAHEAAVRAAVERSATPGIFSVLVSDVVPDGMVLIAKTALLDPTPAELAEQILAGLP